MRGDKCVLLIYRPYESEYVQDRESSPQTKSLAFLWSDRLYFTFTTEVTALRWLSNHAAEFYEGNRFCRRESPIFLWVCLTGSSHVCVCLRRKSRHMPLSPWTFCSVISFSCAAFSIPPPSPHPSIRATDCNGDSGNPVDQATRTHTHAHPLSHMNVIKTTVTLARGVTGQRGEKWQI